MVRGNKPCSDHSRMLNYYRSSTWTLTTKRKDCSPRRHRWFVRTARVKISVHRVKVRWLKIILASRQKGRSRRNDERCVCVLVNRSFLHLLRRTKRSIVFDCRSSRSDLSSSFHFHSLCVLDASRTFLPRHSAVGIYTGIHLMMNIDRSEQEHCQQEDEEKSARVKSGFRLFTPFLLLFSAWLDPINLRFSFGQRMAEVLE